MADYNNPQTVRMSLRGLQYNLGLMHLNGKGVLKDRAIAKEWFGKSCDNGNQKGCDRYRELNLQRK